MKLSNRSSRRAGFTLVEVLIVVLILGILAATVLPQFTQTTRDAKESSLIQNLQMIRHQIALFKFQHEGKLPADASTDAVKFEQQLTQKTNLSGDTDPAGAFGPYILGQLPPNPYSTHRGVVVKNGALASGDYDGSGTHGWAYSSTTGELRANIAPTMMSLVETTKALNSF